MSYKKFDKKLYAENDAKARDRAKKYFSGFGFAIYDNPDQYGPDLILETGSNKCFVECEIKHNWKGPEFPFKDIQFPKRKAKFNHPDTIFFMLNHETTHVFIVVGRDVLSSPLKEISNKYITNGEEFFIVPVEKAYLDEVDNPKGVRH